MDALQITNRRRPTTIFLDEKHNPFDAMAGISVTTEEHSSSYDEAISPSTISNTSQTPWQTPRTTPKRHPLITAYTFPSPNYNPWSTAKAQALEPNYTSTLLLNYDDTTTYRLEAPFIYTSKTNTLPQYQLYQEFTRDGFPARLHIRRLAPREMRSSSVPAIDSQSSPRIRYDANGTLYTVTSDEMKGHKRTGTLCDSIQLSSGRTLWGGQLTRIWRVTHPGRRRNRQRGRDEFDKHLLFAVKKGEWEDCNGGFVAREEGKGRLEMSERIEEDAATRDLVVACWVMRIWMGEGLSWEGI